MRKLITAYALGAGTVILVIVGLMFAGSPFKRMMLKHGVGNGRGIVATERFIVVYEGMEGAGGGSSIFTYAGRHGDIPAFWRGYNIGWGGGDKGIETLRTYEPGFGTATFYFHGRILCVEDDGKYLRVQNQRVPLGSDRVVLVVDAEGTCHQVMGAEADAVLHSVPGWYKDGQISAHPPLGGGAGRAAVMTTAAQTRKLMDGAGEHWRIPLMDFVDDFRYYRDPAAVADPIEPGDPKLDALMASVVDYLCREIGIETPEWVDRTPPSPRPWFVSGLESLKAITLAETPLPFRIRKVFVRDNFLSRA